MSGVGTRDWAGTLADQGVEPDTARRLISQLRACEAASLAFCRLLERWARETPSRAHRGGARRLSTGQPSGRRRRSPGSSGRSLASSSSSSPTSPKADRGTRSPARESSSTGRTCSRGRACTRRRSGCRRCISSWPCSCGRSRGSQTAHGSDRPRIATRSGPGCSTSARTCSTGLPRTCARSPRDAAARRRRRIDQPRPRRTRRPASPARGDGLGRLARPLSRRQGREPGRRVRAARRGSDDDRRGRARRAS